MRTFAKRPAAPSGAPAPSRTAQGPVPQAPGFGNQAMLRTFQDATGAAGGTPAPAAAPVVRKNGTLEFEGEPRTQPLDQPGLNSTGDRLDTHAHRPVIEWPVKITQKGSTTGCLIAGFLQTVTRNDVRATYNPSASCSYDLKVPIRDGHSASPVWMQAITARGDQGFGFLGTCQIAQGPLPPGISGAPTNTTVNVAMTDDPGGFFHLRHPSDTQRLLTSVRESLEFHTWLAVRPQGAAEGTVASYTFLRHLRWVVNREMSVTVNAGGATATLTTNETKVELQEDGQGSATPELGSAVANGSFQENCTLPTPQPRLQEQLP